MWLTIVIKPNKSRENFDLTNLSKFSPIGINIFIPFELCLYNESCPFINISSRIEDKETYLYRFLLHQLYPLNISMTSHPNKELYNYSDVTVNIYYAEEQKKEIIKKGFHLEDYEIIPTMEKR